VLNPTVTPGVNSNSYDNKSLIALARTISFSPFLVSVIVLQSLIDMCLSDVSTASNFEVSFSLATCG
jgi:ABC-type polysaccharide transport system permease subunit